MDKYEKCAASLMELGDKILEKKKHRNMLIRRVSFSCASVFAVVIVGFFAFRSIPPEPEFPNDVIIPESTVITTSAFTNNTSTQTTALVTSSRTETDRVYQSTAAATSSKTSVQTSVSVQQSTETTVKDSSQTQTEPITTNHHTETTSIYEVTTSAATSGKTSKTGTTTTAVYTHTTTTNDGQTTTTTTVIKKPDERIILAIENTDFSRSVSEFKNGEKYKYTGNYMKLTDVSDYEYIGSFKVFYYFGPIKDEMSSVYKVYAVPDEEDKAAVQFDNSDFFLIFEKCIQE